MKRKRRREKKDEEKPGSHIDRGNLIIEAEKRTAKKSGFLIPTKKKWGDEKYSKGIER